MVYGHQLISRVLILSKQPVPTINRFNDIFNIHFEISNIWDKYYHLEALNIHLLSNFKSCRSNKHTQILREANLHQYADFHIIGYKIYIGIINIQHPKKGFVYTLFLSVITLIMLPSPPTAKV